MPVWEFGQVLLWDASGSSFVPEDELDIVVDTKQQVFSEFLEREAGEGLVLPGCEVEEAVG